MAAGERALSLSFAARTRAATVGSAAPGLTTVRGRSACCNRSRMARDDDSPAGRRARERKPESPSLVDVVSEIEIRRPRSEVAEYVCDQDNAPDWYKAISSVEWKTPRAVAVGAQIAFVARFLGSPLVYTYEIRELVPGERFVMSTADGPFEMETTYEWSDAGDGATRMTLRNRGEASRFGKLAAGAVATAMRRANRKDLQRLKKLLEQ
jgi:hypothetical protein